MRTLSRTCARSAGLRNRYMRAVTKLVSTVHHDGFAGLQSLQNRNLIGRSRPGGHRSHAHRVIGVGNVDVAAGSSLLEARARDDDRIVYSIDQQMDIDELIRKQLKLGIV